MCSVQHGKAEALGGSEAVRMVAELGPLANKPDSLTDMVYEAIRNAIVRKVLLPGTRVPEVTLARQLQVSKTPVREALLRLQLVGLVEPDGNRGARVVEPSESAILGAYEVRAALELATAQLAAQRATSDERIHMQELAAESLSHAEAGDVEGFRYADGIFHRAIATAAGNPQLYQLVDNALTLASALRQRDLPTSDDSAKCARNHVRIAAAIKRRNAKQAGELMQAHVEEVRNMLLADLHPPAHAVPRQPAATTVTGAIAKSSSS